MSNLTFIVVFASVLFLVILIAAVLLRRVIRRSFIVVAEVLVLFANLIFVLACGAVGGGSANHYAQLSALPGSFLTDNAALIGFCLAAFGAFLISSVISAAFFLLIQIEFNTRKVADYFDRMVRARAEA